MTIHPDLIEILLMLFADDVKRLSFSVVGFQAQLNILRNVSVRLDLVVNLKKSKVKGFFSESNERAYTHKNELVGE